MTQGKSFLSQRLPSIVEGMQDTSSDIKVFVICYVIYGSNKELFFNKFQSMHFITKSDMITGNNQRLVIEGVLTINQRSKCFFPNACCKY